MLNMSSSQRVVCPKCQRSDRVQKVSAIVAQGTKVVEEGSTIYTETSDGSDYIPVTYDSVRRTPLARKLAPPSKPPQSRGNGCVAGLIMTRLGVALAVSLIVITLFFCSYPFLAATYTQNNVVFISVLVFGIAVIGLTLLWAVRASWKQSRSTNWNNSCDARLQAWEAAYARWKQLYYCLRDDVVFIPGHSTLMAAEQVQNYLNAEVKRKQSS
jgi:hypothetical protein